MNILNLLSLLISFTLVSCASFQDKHNCNFNTVKLNNAEYRICSVKDPTKNIYGVTYGKSETWLIEPKYTSVETFNGKELYATKDGGGVVRYNFKTNEMEETEYLAIESAKKAYHPTSRPMRYVRFKNGTDISALNSDGIAVKQKISNVDAGAILKSSGGVVDPVYASNFGGFYVRHKEGDTKYYKIYSNNGTALSQAFPEREIVLLQSFGSQNVHPFHRIDKEQDLYWPLFTDSVSYFKKPDYLKGIIIVPEMYFDNDQPRTFPTYMGMGFVFYGENGQEDYVVLKYMTNSDSQINSINDFKRMMAESRVSPNRYYDYSWMEGQVAGKTGRKILNQKYVILKKPDGKYGYTYDASWLSGTFEDKNAVIADINKTTLNVDKSAIVNQQRAMQNALENQQVRAEVKVQVDNDIRAEREKAAEQQAKYDAAKKAENDKIWDSVSNQVKDAANKASKKAKCIGKNTQTKKDFLNNKQDWYTDGGCDTP